MEDEIRLLLKKLVVPPELLRFRDAQAKRAAFLSVAHSSLSSLKQLTAAARSYSYHRELVKDILFTLSTFACDGEGQEWTTGELSVLSTSTIDVVACALHSDDGAISTSKCREKLVVAQLYEMLLVVQKSLKHGSKPAGDESLFSDDSHDFTDDVLLAHRMTWLLKQVGHPCLGQNCEMVMPCVLTALDHFSPPVKAQAMQAFLHIAQNMNASELRWYKDVILDAVCNNLIGSNELWPLAVKMAVALVTRIEGSNPRALWYRKTMNEMIRDLELHQTDKLRRTAWLEQIGPQLEAMGLVLVVHLERLLNLFFYWLSDSDNGTIVLVLSCLALVIRVTWPRIPYHASRIWEALAKLYQQKMDTETLRAVAETGSLLVQCCGGVKFLEGRRKSDDPLFLALESAATQY